LGAVVLVATCWVQLYLMRTMLESLVEKGEKSKNKHLPRKDINPSHVVLIENFLQSSFFWTNLLDLTGELVTRWTNVDQTDVFYSL
jgi:Cytoplasmic Fragile-X interacting family